MADASLSRNELEQYLLQSLNMALGSLIQGETSYTNSFDCRIQDDGFLFFLAYQLVTLLMMFSIRKSF